MKNSKKGFTLIEVLAVIIIIGLLLIIGIPAISRNINTSSRRIYENHINTIIEAAKADMTDCLAKNLEVCNIPEPGESLKYSLSDLIDMGYIEEGLKNPGSNKKQEFCNAAETFVDIKNIANGDNKYDFEYNVCSSDNYKSYCKIYLKYV